VFKNYQGNVRKFSSLFFFYLEWATDISHKFYPAFQGITDYGACCLIVPYLNLINPETMNLDPTDGINNSFYHNIPKGAKNGLQNGLKIVLDVENFDYAYFPRGAKGFRVALTSALDQAVINQDGFYIAPGIEKIENKLKQKRTIPQSHYSDFWMS
jgi:hypothetical protein